MRSSLKRTLRVLWWLLAGAVSVLALASFGLRLLLPGLDAQRPAIEQAVADITGTPISIGELGATWRGFWPRLTLKDLRVAPTADGQAGLQVAAIELTVSLMRSLKAGDLVLDALHLEGLSASVQRTPDGRFQLTGIPPARSPLIGWLLRQHAIEIDNASLTLEDQQHGSPRLHFEGLDVRLRQTPESTVIRAHFDSVGPLGTAPDLELHLAKAAQAASELRIAVKALPLAPWAAFAGQPALAAHVGQIDGRFWLRHAAGEWRHVGFDTRVGLVAATPEPAADPLTLRGAADFAEGEWRLRLAQPAFGASAQTSAPPPVLGLLRRTAERTQLLLHTSALPLDFVSRLSAAFNPGSSLPPLTGHLSNLRLGLEHTTPGALALYAAGDLDPLDAQHGAARPALRGLRARFALNRKGGALALADAEFQLEHPERLIAPLQFDGVQGLLRWQQRDRGWRFQLPHLQANLQGLPLQAVADVDWTPGSKPRLNLELSMGPGDLTAVPSLLPTGLLHPRGEAWCRNAFASGHLEAVHLSLHGDMARFPFDQGEGLFSVDFAVSDADMRYSPKWPVLPGASGHGVVVGRHLQAVISQAQFVSSPTSDIVLSVADLFSRDPYLLIDGTVHANLPDTKEILAQSPLQGLAKRLGAVEIDDRFDVSLALNIGLRRNSPSNVNGKVVLKGNELRSVHDGLTLQDVTGTIDFADHHWAGQSLQAKLDGTPVTLGAAIGQGEQQGDTNITLAGDASPAFISHYLRKYVPTVHRWLAASGSLEVLNGSALWQAHLHLPAAVADAPPPPRQLKIESSLQGLALALPWPFGKPAETVLPFSLDTTLGDPAAHLTRLQFGDRVTLGVRHGGAEGSAQMLGLEVALGAGEALRGATGINFHGKIPVFSVDDWRGLFEHVDALGGGPELPLAYQLQIDEVNVLGQHFPAVKLNGSRNTRFWNASIESPQIAGTLRGSRSATGAPLLVQLSRLWLAPMQGGDDTAKVDPRTLKTLDLRCESFRYGSIDFGRAALRTVQIADGQRLESLSFTQPAFSLNATGEWTLREQAHHSQFDIKLEAGALGPMLGAFGFQMAAIENGATRLGISAGWNGMPSEFSLARLNGKLSLQVDAGRFLDIDPGSGRIFGLLSLQTLPRRLALDFSDLFDKGFAFDRIDGNFALEDGNAYTNDLRMEGPAARIEVTGRTGLAAKDYDQRATVTPEFSAGLPLAGALFGPAGIGVGAALYLSQQVFTEIPEKIDSLLSSDYLITGAWQDPKIEKQ